MVTERDSQSSRRPPGFGRQVSTQVNLEQRRLLDQLADERQLPVSALIREAIREFLAAASRPAALTR
jgi:predicted transcriptional regulator